jgi:putative ABC transport system permease protein
MFVLKLILRNVFRHRLRSLLTVAGVAIAILAFGMLRTLTGLWEEGMKHASPTRLITRNATSLIFPLPIAYLERIRQLPGVTRVAHGVWFGGIYIDEKNFFASYAVEPRNYLALYPEFLVDPPQLDAFLRERKGCMVGASLAKRFGWKLGDPIVLRGTIYPGQWEFILRAIYRGKDKTVDERAFIFHWDYLNERLRTTVPAQADQTGFFMVGVSRPEAAATVAASIDLGFKNSLAETITETEAAFHLNFLAMTEAILLVIEIVSYVVIAIIMVVAANTMAMTARERTAEYATLKTIGFGPAYIAAIIGGESLAIALIGGAIGIALTFPAAQLIETALRDYFPFFAVTPKTLLYEVLASLSIGVTAAIFPTWRGATIRIAKGLRRVG